MIVLIPVSRFRVAYELARGRPYSRLERRVLEAIAGGGATLHTLTTAFHVHERLMVESVVTLVNAGWVAVAGGTEATFVLTVEGSAAIDADRDPVSVTVTQANPQILVLERVSGQLARHADARSYNRDDLADVWQSAAIVGPHIFRNALDEAQVQKLLPRGTGEWVRWVGPITLASKNGHFLPVDVDQQSGEVRGLPPSWRKPLMSHVVAAARRRRAQDAEDTALAARPGGDDGQRKQAQTSGEQRRRPSFISVTDAAMQRPPHEALVALGPDNVLVGTDAHDRALKTALDSAVHNLLLASPSIDRDRLTVFLADAVAAVRRRVRVDILPGSTPDEFGQDAVIDAVNRTGYQAVGNDGRTLLRTGTQATGSDSSLLLYDDASGRLVAVVGDHDWLGRTATATPVSVRLADPAIVGNLARAGASLWTSGQQGTDAGAADRWRHLASATEERAAKAETEAESSVTTAATSVEVVIDDEHLITPPENDGAARVGRFSSEANNERYVARGLSLLLIGPGADLVTNAQTQS